MSGELGEVLIADDERSVREMLRVSLENVGYHVFEAADGRATLRMLRQGPCRMVVILDADLPGASAHSILASAVDDARIGRHSFVYLTSARPEQENSETQQQLAQCGVPVLRTPLTMETLVEAVGQAADRKGV